jgi:hypothetical protein
LWALAVKGIDEFWGQGWRGVQDAGLPSREGAQLEVTTQVWRMSSWHQVEEALSFPKDLRFEIKVLVLRYRCTLSLHINH